MYASQKVKQQILMVLSHWSPAFDTSKPQQFHLYGKYVTKIQKHKVSKVTNDRLVWVGRVSMLEFWFCCLTFCGGYTLFWIEYPHKLLVDWTWFDLPTSTLSLHQSYKPGPNHAYVTWTIAYLFQMHCCFLSSICGQTFFRLGKLHELGLRILSSYT